MLILNLISPKILVLGIVPLILIVKACVRILSCVLMLILTAMFLLPLLLLIRQLVLYVKSKESRCVVKYRKRLSRSGSKRLFRKTAARIHKKNFIMPNRGGLRM